MDVLLILDPSTGTAGPIEIETVTHVMNQDQGSPSCLNKSVSRAGARSAPRTC
jgi:hypothetical protein